MKISKLLLNSIILLAFSFNSGYAEPVSAEDIDPGAIPPNEVHADSQQPAQQREGYPNYNADGAAAVIETLLVRPIGFATTICGTALFVGMSPLTALASIPHPHDAFEKTANALIVAPAEYTFTRPLGDFSYQSRH